MSRQSQVICPRARKTSKEEDTRDERIKKVGFKAKEWAVVVRVLARNKRLRQKWARHR